MRNGAGDKSVSGLISGHMHGHDGVVRIGPVSAPQRVILVDENDVQRGVEEKLRAHENGGNLHRAFSVFVFDTDGKLLLQKRASSKYHAGGLWANTCCSHPAPGESVEDAAHRRLQEEMGFDCELREVFSFIYKADVGNGLTEHEFDHVFFGTFDGNPMPNKEEVEEWQRSPIGELRKDVALHPEKYAPWLKIAVEKHLEHYLEKLKEVSQ